MGCAVTKIWGSAEMSVLWLEVREHFQVAEQRDRGMLTVRKKVIGPIDGG
jgi:hypothetical protein